MPARLTPSQFAALRRQLDDNRAIACKPRDVGTLRRQLAAPTERQLQRNAVAMLREALGPLFIVRAIPNHRIVSHLPEAARRRYLRAMAADGVISGSADIEVLSRGRCLQLELKRDAKAPIGDDQIAFADACRRAGCPHHFLWNLDAIFDAVRSWCVACGFEVPGVLNRLLGFSATTRE